MGARSYRVDADVRDLPPKIRCTHRPAPAGLLLANLHGWFEHLLTRTSTKSEIAKAARCSFVR